MSDRDFVFYEYEIVKGKGYLNGLAGWCASCTESKGYKLQI